MLGDRTGIARGPPGTEGVVVICMRRGVGLDKVESRLESLDADEVELFRSLLLIVLRPIDEKKPLLDNFELIELCGVPRLGGRGERILEFLAVLARANVG